MALLDDVPIELDRTGLPFDSASFRYGISVFDALKVVRVVKGSVVTFKVYRPRDHIKRFQLASSVVGIPISQSDDAILQGIEKVIAMNLPDRHFGVRLFAFERSPRLLGGHASLLIFLLNLELVRPDNVVRLAFAKYPKPNDQALPASVKCTAHYVRNRIELFHADRYVTDLVHCCEAGFVLETSKANIFAVKGNSIVTPSSTQNILPGITRRSIIEILTSREFERYDIREERISRDLLLNADEVFLTSTSIGVVSVARLEERDFGSPVVAPRLASALDQAQHSQQNSSDFCFELSTGLS